MKVESPEDLNPSLESLEPWTGTASPETRCLHSKDACGVTQEALVARIRALELQLREKNPTNPNTTPSPSPHPRFLHSSPEALNDLTLLRTLPQKSSLLLLTPVVIPFAFAAQPPNNADPFEPLGRALSRHHARIRHVPYVPAVGFTGIHARFLVEAGAVVVVVCEPRDSDLKIQSLQHQGVFVRDVVDALQVKQEAEGDLEGLRALPRAVVRFTREARAKGMGREFGVVVQCEGYDAEGAVAREVADLMFTGGMGSSVETARVH